jgi:hypothetical protein
MEAFEAAEQMYGDKLYQRRAREALPILVRQAQAETPISYSELAEELGMPNPRNLNYVLGSIGETLQGLSKVWGVDIPAIQCLVLNRNTGLPGEGIGWFITNRSEFAAKPKRERKRLVDAELQKVFTFGQWGKVLKDVGLEPVEPSYRSLLKGASAFRGGGESDQHRLLKEYVAANPGLIQLPDTLQGAAEYALPSGDCVDVMFICREELVAVEVKSRISPDADIVRGLFQCVKYRAVTQATLDADNDARLARAILVLEGKLPSSLVPLRNVLGVQVYEEVVPIGAGSSSAG